LSRGVYDVLSPGLPREGHLEQVFHIFAHLKKYHNTEVVYDPSEPVIDVKIIRTGYQVSLGTWILWRNCLPTYQSPEAKAL
jgi:hypothetical protein